MASSNDLRYMSRTMISVAILIHLFVVVMNPFIQLPLFIKVWHVMGVVAAKKDLVHIIKNFQEGTLVHACNQNVCVITNSGHCNSMMDKTNFQCVRMKL